MGFMHDLQIDGYAFAVAVVAADDAAQAFDDVLFQPGPRAQAPQLQFQCWFERPGEAGKGDAVVFEHMAFLVDQQGADGDFSAVGSRAFFVRAEYFDQFVGGFVQRNGTQNDLEIQPVMGSAARFRAPRNAV